jgi:hypothetical protein
MDKWIKTEELLQFLLGIYAFSTMDWNWWWFAIWLLVPDISIAAYALGPKIGAIIYNIFHHKGIAIVIGLLGWIGHYEYLLFAGIILFSHSAMDRLFGYGLKFSDHFKHTHLGWIGKLEK